MSSNKPHKSLFARIFDIDDNDEEGNSSKFSFSSLFTRDIGIDLGTANTLVFIKGKGILIREPSVVAVDVRTDRVLAVGTAAKDMIGRTPGSIVAVRPLKDGVIADFNTTSEMLKAFINRAIKMSGPLLRKPRVLICIPSGVTEVERRAVKDSAIKAGAKYVKTIEEPKASAIGAGLPVNEPVGTMVVDIGGGTSEVAVLSLNGIVTSRSVRVAGDDFDDAIIAYIKRKYNLLIGERTAEEIKIKIGSACEYENEGSMEIRGRNLMDGLPKNTEITAEEVREALTDSLNAILDSIRSTLEKTPPELSADIISHGITLTGGGALLRGLSTLIAEETRIPVHTAEHPLDCVVDGTGFCLENNGIDDIGWKDYD